MSIDPGALLHDYGLLAILFGTFLEGETILLAGVWAARHGYLSLSAVVGCAVLGAFVSDQLYFFAGRLLGERWLGRHRRLARSRERVWAALSRHQNAFILSFRFLYGLRTVVPLVLGASGVSAGRFLLLDFFAVCAWTATLAFGGLVASRVWPVLGHMLPTNQARAVAVALALPLSLAAATAALARRWRKAALSRPTPAPAAGGGPRQTPSR